jgi:hypothetical protein
MHLEALTVHHSEITMNTTLNWLHSSKSHHPTHLLYYMLYNKKRPS